MNSEELRITDIWALEALDSRGNPTLYTQVELKNGVCEGAFVPSGASTGAREAVELRDGDQARYLGKGVTQAILAVNGELRGLLIGRDVTEQAVIDELMCSLDGTENKSRLGANAILSVSLACARAAASARGEPLYQYLQALYTHEHGGQEPYRLPLPMMNILNGGAHADNNVDIQEFMVMPWNFDSFAEALRAGVEIFHHLHTLLKDAGYNTGVGDEGGFAPDLKANTEALELVFKAVERAGYTDSVRVSLDCAASEFYADGHYSVDGKKLTAEQWVKYVGDLAERYSVLSIEDGVCEDDWAHWKLLGQRLGDQCQLVGDDVFVTNPDIFAQGIADKIGNAILVKFNQIGTLSETFKTIVMAQQAGYGVVISHRSGETEDTTIADLAVATGAGQIKTGSLSRGERTAKYNRLLMIERTNSGTMSYAGPQVLRNWL